MILEISTDEWELLRRMIRWRRVWVEAKLTMAIDTPDYKAAKNEAAALIALQDYLNTGKRNASTSSER